MTSTHMCEKANEPHFLQDINLAATGDNGVARNALFADVMTSHCFRNNRPAIFRNAQLLTDPNNEACFDLTKLQQTLHLDNCVDLFGRSHVVPVTTTSESSECEATTASLGMTLEEYIKLAHSRNNTDHHHYLKDWHFVLEACEAQLLKEERPLEGNALYRLPGPLQLDWLNGYMLGALSSKSSSRESRSCWKQQASRAAMAPYPDLFGRRSERHPERPRSDFRFVYMGPCGTSTPRHKDVFGSFSWSFNVQGSKRWIFYQTDNDGHPALLHHAPPPNEVEHVIVQNPGDLIFVPSELDHVVFNEREDAPITDSNEGASQSPSTASDLVVSINQNWFNQYSIRRVVNLLCNEAISFHRTMDEDCRGAFRGDIDQCTSVESKRAGDGGSCPICSLWSPQSFWERDGWVIQVERVLESSGSWNLSSMFCVLHDVAITSREGREASSDDESSIQCLEAASWCLEKLRSTYDLLLLKDV